jgi:hypothetical protein
MLPQLYQVGTPLKEDKVVIRKNTKEQRMAKEDIKYHQELNSNSIGGKVT